MSETKALPPPEPPTEPPTPEPAPPPANRLAWLTGGGFLVLVAALLLVWRNPVIPPPSTELTDALARQVAVLDARVSRLEQRPPPPAPDLAPLAARITALEQRPAPAAAPPAGAAPPPPSPDLAPDVAALSARIATLEQRQPPSLAPLETKLATLEADALAAQSDVARRLAADEARLAASEKRAVRATQVQAASLALDAGRRLGDLPGAPAALARYAAALPPTEAALRLAFPAAAREALAVAQPATDGKPLLNRLWSQAQELVTIRQGDHVLLGDPTAGVLQRARAALDAGDLPASVAAIATLEGPPAQAMAAWLDQARALLDARAALAAWAAAG
ncbi:MAG: mitofilin family membrane protein [Acetobacteraceae bacterium]